MTTKFCATKIPTSKHIDNIKKQEDLDIEVLQTIMQLTSIF